MVAPGDRGGRWVRWSATLGLAAVAGFWPLAYRYTSFGLDLERERDGRVVATFYRLRWPGDGSVVVAYLVEHRALAEGPVLAWDLGGSFLQPAPALAPTNGWQAHGFWCVAVAPGTGPAPPIVAGADRALLVGVPHWLVVLLTAGVTVWLHRRPRSLAPAASA